MQRFLSQFGTVNLNGQFERYYGTEGAAYVNTIKHEIRTTYSRAEFDENTTALIEEMKKNGILG